MKSGITIALDGPAGSGKSTTARQVAKRLGYTFIDSGAMYRGVTLKVLQEKVDVSNEALVGEIAKNMEIDLKPHPEKTLIFVDGKDVSGDIRTEEIAKNISPVARNPLVRQNLVERQQEMGKKGSVVMDGRDIGTVVFPFAELKVYMTASPEVRAKRRLGEYEKSGAQCPPLEEILADIKQRDHNDMTREVGPLKQAEDAVLLDTDNMTIDQQIDFVVNLAQERAASKN